MNLEDLSQIIKISWNKETCHESSKQLWKEENPSLGQCAVTTLIVNDFIGGKIMRCMCNNISHYYNIHNGNLIDLTKEQFEGVIPDYDNSEERSREYLLSNLDTKNRYLLLLRNVKNNFIQFGNHEYKLLGADQQQYISKIPGTIGGNKKIKIYGRLDCKSALRYIDKGYYEKNRVFFANEEDAISAGYRPCAICMTNQYKLWKENNKSKTLKK